MRDVDVAETPQVILRQPRPAAGYAVDGDEDYDDRPVYDASAAYLWGIAIGGVAVGALWAFAKAVMS